MNADASGLWWTLVLVDSAVGAGFFIYGVRQREPLPFVMGIVLSVLPMVPASGLTLLVLSALCCVTYMLARKLF